MESPNAFFPHTEVTLKERARLGEFSTIFSTIVHPSTDTLSDCRGYARRRDRARIRALVLGNALARIRHRRRARALRGVVPAVYVAVFLLRVSVRSHPSRSGEHAYS